MTIDRKKGFLKKRIKVADSSSLHWMSFYYLNYLADVDYAE